MDFERAGYCPICRAETVFSSKCDWFRDNLLCGNCKSIPRERALVEVLERLFPNWPELRIHESSPTPRGASSLFARECDDYLSTCFWPGNPTGQVHESGMLCENLEKLTFPDESFDLHITQDVFEHLFDPAAAAREIARTLKPGGAHIFTTPLVNRAKPSRQVAFAEPDGSVRHLEEPEYHGNPTNEGGSLVTVRWGYDIVSHIFDASGLFTFIFHIDDISKGIRADLNEVLVTMKQAETG